MGYDLLMINDKVRNDFWRVDRCKGKVVLDIGTGTGLLSVMAASAGAKKVYTFEYDETNYKAAKYFIEQAGMADIVTIINADVLSVDADCWTHDPIDIVTTETFANDCFTENFAVIVEHVEHKLNCAKNLIWYPEQIDLRLTLVNQDPVTEFDPGIQLPQGFNKAINDSIAIFRNNYYQSNSVINLPVAKIAKYKPTDSMLIDTFYSNSNLRSTIETNSYSVEFDHSNVPHPYLKIDWVLKNHRSKLWLNNCKSWYSIAFHVDKTRGNTFYLRFNPLTHALLCSQN
jgi:predicted RNA methylase|tara:strand:- start:28 stop:885 length:858 start_codon:yes stop_codon:yes gene_type:complete